MTFDNAYWSNRDTLNANVAIESDCLKTSAFVHRLCRYLAITCQDRYTVLALPTQMTLYHLFQRPQATALTCVMGCKTPSLLINGQDHAYIGPPWRVNAGIGTPNCIRLGGYIDEPLVVTQGHDDCGAIGPALSGCGLAHSPSCPPVAFGIRRNDGRVTSSCCIYGF
jgi:hypothetical protein